MLFSIVAGRGGMAQFNHPEFGGSGQSMSCRGRRKGRADFLRQFPSPAFDAAQARLRAPELAETFRACVLDGAKRILKAVALHPDLLALRRCDRAFEQGENESRRQRVE